MQPGDTFERKSTGGRVASAGCELEERISSFSRVVAGIASIRWWTNRLRRRQKRKSRRGLGRSEETRAAKAFG